MRNYRFTGFFQNEYHEYELTVVCMSFNEAYFLLMAEAINSAKHRNLYSITDEKGKTLLVEDMNNINIFKK